MQPKNYIQLFVPVTYAKVWVTGVNRSSSMQQEEQIIFSMMPKVKCRVTGVTRLTSMHVGVVLMILPVNFELTLGDVAYSTHLSKCFLCPVKTEPKTFRIEECT